MMQLWSPALTLVALGLQGHALWEMSGYFSFRDSYFIRADRSVRYFDAQPDLQRAADALAAVFEVRIRPDMVLVRRRHGATKRLLAHASVVVVEDGYEVRSGAGPRAALGVGCVLVPVFGLGPLFGGPVLGGVFILMVGALLFFGLRYLLQTVARRFGEEVSIHL